MYKILLYVIFAFCVSIFIGHITYAEIQPYSIPTKEAEKYNNQPWSIPTEAVYLALYASRLNVPILLREIGRCESGNTLNAKNPNSSARGEYQFIKSSWKHYGKELWGDDWINKDIFSKDNEELAIYVYNKYGTDPWLESKSCWGKIELALARH